MLNNTNKSHTASEYGIWELWIIPPSCGDEMHCYFERIEHTSNHSLQIRWILIILTWIFNHKIFHRVWKSHRRAIIIKWSAIVRLKFEYTLFIYNNHGILVKKEVITKSATKYWPPTTIFPIFFYSSIFFEDTWFFRFGGILIRTTKFIPLHFCSDDRRAEKLPTHIMQTDTVWAIDPRHTQGMWNG